MGSYPLNGSEERQMMVGGGEFYFITLDSEQEERVPLVGIGIYVNKAFYVFEAIKFASK